MANLFKALFGNTPGERKHRIIALSVVGIIIIAVIAIGIYNIVSEKEVIRDKEQTFDTSSYAELAIEENAFQFSDSVVETSSVVFAVDSSRITARKVGTNNEDILVEGNLEPGIVTDGKTLYYYDLDTETIMSVDVDSRDKKEVIKVPDNIKVDEKSFSAADCYFARFDGAYGDYLYYQVGEGEEYMPNYMVNVKTGEVTKLSLTDYGTYKFQIAGGKLYFDMFRTMSVPTVLYRSEPDGSDREIIVEGISNFEVIGDKIYYFKAEDLRSASNKIMSYDIKTGEHSVIKEDMKYTSGGFTSYAMIYDMTIGNTMHTIVDYYEGGGEALDGNGVKICGEVAIVHAGVPEDISSEDALEQASVPEWYLVGNGTRSDIIKLPENTTPANYKDGYFYYYTYTEDGRSIMNRTKINY